MSIIDRLLRRKPPINAETVLRPGAGKHHGTVKWWREAKGFGFLTQEDGTDVFVHFSAIQCVGRKNLKQGEAVEFDVVKGPKSFQAVNVVRERDLGQTPKQEMTSEPERAYVALALFGEELKAVDSAATAPIDF